jgi:hypothetical protein
MPSAGSGVASADQLPELAQVRWRARASEESLAHRDRVWTIATVAHTLPFLASAVLLPALNLLMLPVALLALAFAWTIPELYAARGAHVLRARPPSKGRAERIAVGLLGDLLGHAERELHARTSLVLERGQLGVWLLAEAGAVLVRPGARRVHCYCVSVTDAEMPASDRTAHLLLALRTDEAGFATVANLAFAGARWRLRRRVRAAPRAALDAAARAARPRQTRAVL